MRGVVGLARSVGWILRCSEATVGGTMDNVTHTMLGVAMARAGLAQRYGRGTTLVLAVASNLPDLDALWALAGLGDSHLSRRMLTHSVPGLLLLSMVSATVFRWIYREQPWDRLFWLSLLAMAVHVGFDLVNSYGVVLFYPFSRARYELAWVFIIDLAIWGLLLAPLALGPLFRRRIDPAWIWRTSLIAVGLYVVLCGVTRTQANGVLQDLAAARPVTPELAYVFPEPLGPHRFRGVIKEPGNGYRVYLIHVPSGEAELRAELSTDERHPAVRQARASEKGRKLEWFFQAPVWELEGRADQAAQGSEGRWCAVYDLRFDTLVIDRGNPFRYLFRLDNGVAEPIGWQREIARAQGSE